MTHIASPTTYPARTRYYFQNPETGNPIFVTYEFTKGRALAQVWRMDHPELEPFLDAQEMHPADAALVRSLSAPNYHNQVEFERELRTRRIDWTADVLSGAKWERVPELPSAFNAPRPTAPPSSLEQAEGLEL